MTENADWAEWKKNKIRDKKVQGWLARFREVDGKSDEWQKVYKLYLQSDVWQEKRKQVLGRADGRCERCKAIIFDPDVHHLTYDRVGGNERLEDLVVLCSSCHKIADEERDFETTERRTDTRYDARLNGFATRKYGDSWWFDHEREDVETEFILFLYKGYCHEYGFDFDPRLDPESDLDFIVFRNNVLNGAG